MLYKKLSARFKVYPSKANFLLLDVSPMSAEEFFKKMLEKKIIVRKFGKYKGFKGDYVRITVGTEKENKRLIEAVNLL
jgi:histidinol-phosphate aminotransferase